MLLQLFAVICNNENLAACTVHIILIIQWVKWGLKTEYGGSIYNYNLGNLVNLLNTNHFWKNEYWFHNYEWLTVHMQY